LKNKKKNPANFDVIICANLNKLYEKKRKEKKRKRNRENRWSHGHFLEM